MSRHALGRNPPNHPPHKLPVHCLQSQRYQPETSPPGKPHRVLGRLARPLLSRRLDPTTTALEAILGLATCQSDRRILCRTALMFRFRTITTRPVPLSDGMVEIPEILVHHGSRGMLETSGTLEILGTRGIHAIVEKQMTRHGIQETTGLGYQRGWIVLARLSDVRQKVLEMLTAPKYRPGMLHARIGMPHQPILLSALLQPLQNPHPLLQKQPSRR